MIVTDLKDFFSMSERGGINKEKLSVKSLELKIHLK